MRLEDRIEVGEVSPTEAQDLLRDNPGARLVDVRTQAEWDFVGVPNVSDLGQTLYCVEWASHPGMIQNGDFVRQLDEALGEGDYGPVLFLCRSGVRSLRAAAAFAEHMANLGRPVACLNVAEGFEGDLDPDRHRGGANGWKARGLPWQQS